MSTLSVRLIQTNLFWEDKAANLNHLEKEICSSNQHVDLIVLPEMFTSGFSMSASSLAEEMDGNTVQWMTRIAKSRESAICGSIIVKENNNFYNRLIWVNPEGTIYYYDKRHLFTFASEDNYYHRGDKKIIIEYKDWKICPLICYDLRFPVWSRNDCYYDLLIYVANWPSPRAHAWNNLLVSRAIENLCYTIGVNRIGKDANGLNYLGDSCVIDYNGKVLQKEREKKISIFETLNKDKMLEFRKKLNFLGDRDSFQLIP